MRINLRPASKGTETTWVAVRRLQTVYASIYDPHRRVLKRFSRTCASMAPLRINLRPASKGTETPGGLPRDVQARGINLRPASKGTETYTSISSMTVGVRINLRPASKGTETPDGHTTRTANTVASIYDPHRRVLKHFLRSGALTVNAPHQSTTRIEGY